MRTWTSVRGLADDEQGHRCGHGHGVPDERAGITEGSAKIVAATLGMSAAGTIAVNAASNDVTNLAAETSSGTITYQDANALTLPSLGRLRFGQLPGLDRQRRDSDQQCERGHQVRGLLTINNDIVAARARCT